jgi:predicted DsbA family dithiol-disulfide isomerase
MSDRVENTGLDCQRFAARDEAQQAADAVNADHPGAKAEVIEVAGEPTTTFAAWNES